MREAWRRFDHTVQNTAKRLGTELVARMSGIPTDVVEKIIEQGDKERAAAREELICRYRADEPNTEKGSR